MSGAAMISWYDPNAVSSWCASQNACARSREREAAATATAPGAYAKSSTTLAAIRPGPTMPHLTSAAPLMPLTLELPAPALGWVGGWRPEMRDVVRSLDRTGMTGSRTDTTRFTRDHDSFQPAASGRPAGRQRSPPT